MSTTANKYVELENILSFLGILFIDYKGHRTSNGHKTAKTIGEIKDFFGYEVMTSGQSIKELDSFWNFKEHWGDLMLLVEKIENLEPDRFKVEIYDKQCVIYDMPEQHAFINWEESKKIEAVYNACLEFINWLNEQNK